MKNLTLPHPFNKTSDNFTILELIRLNTGHFRKDGAVENTLFENDQITKQQDYWLLATNIRTHLLKQLSYPIQYWNYVLRILINLNGVSWMGHNGWIAQKKISLEE
jgi:hypothetical protein